MQAPSRFLGTTTSAALVAILATGSYACSSASEADSTEDGVGPGGDGSGGGGSSGGASSGLDGDLDIEGDPYDGQGFMPLGVLAGNYHTVCNVRREGAAVCWGWGGSGQFGVAVQSATEDTGPETLPGIDNARSVGAGIDFSCVGLSTGRVVCAGDNNSGELGRAEAPGKSTEFAAVDGITDAIFVQAGYRHACALHASGKVSCWGSNSHQQLGPNAESAAMSKVPVDVPGAEGAKSISVGSTHVCVIKEDRSVFCWGRNDSGQIGVDPDEADTV